MTVSPLLVERWARACEVQTRIGLEHEQLNLLDNALVASIGALRAQNVDKLVTIVKAANRDASIPDKKALQVWIRRAKAKPETVLPQLNLKR